MSHSTPANRRKPSDFLFNSDRGDLSVQFRFIEAVGLDGTPAVLGNSKIFEAQRLRGFRHFFERVVAVTRCRVTMKCSSQVFLLDQFWERMLFGSSEFPAIFP